jgi:hypothetical protein
MVARLGGIAAPQVIRYDYDNTSFEVKKIVFILHQAFILVIKQVIQDPFFL